MELLFIVLIAFCIGLGLRYLLPGRDTYGSVLMASISAAVAAVVWVGLTWLGWKFDGGWIWVVSLGLGGIVAFVATLLIPRRRRTHDEELMRTLSRA